MFSTYLVVLFACIHISMLTRSLLLAEVGRRDVFRFESFNKEVLSLAAFPSKSSLHNSCRLQTTACLWFREPNPAGYITVNPKGPMSNHLHGIILLGSLKRKISRCICSNFITFGVRNRVVVMYLTDRATAASIISLGSCFDAYISLIIGSGRACTMVYTVEARLRACPFLQISIVFCRTRCGLGDSIPGLAGNLFVL